MAQSLDVEENLTHGPGAFPNLSGLSAGFGSSHQASKGIGKTHCILILGLPKNSDQAAIPRERSVPSLCSLHLGEIQAQRVNLTCGKQNPTNVDPKR